MILQLENTNYFIPNESKFIEYIKYHSFEDLVSALEVFHTLEADYQLDREGYYGKTRICDAEPEFVLDKAGRSLQAPQFCLSWSFSDKEGLKGRKNPFRDIEKAKEKEQIQIFCSFIFYYATFHPDKIELCFRSTTPPKGLIPMLKKLGWKQQEPKWMKIYTKPVENSEEAMQILLDLGADPEQLKFHIWFKTLSDEEKVELSNQCQESLFQRTNWYGQIDESSPAALSKTIGRILPQNGRVYPTVIKQTTPFCLIGRDEQDRPYALPAQEKHMLEIYRILKKENRLP